MEMPVKHTFADESLSDLVLVINGEEFHVHKMILAAHSKVFKSMFYGGFKEEGQPRIEIPHQDPVAFNRLIEFIYFGKIEDAPTFLRCCKVGKANEGSKKFWSEATALMKAADYFGVEKMRDYVKNEIGTGACCLGCGECLDGFVFGVLYKLEVAQAEKRYKVEIVQSWTKNCSQHVPKDLDANASIIPKLFQQITSK